MASEVAAIDVALVALAAQVINAACALALSAIRVATYVVLNASATVQLKPYR